MIQKRKSDLHSEINFVQRSAPRKRRWGWGVALVYVFFMGLLSVAFMNGGRPTELMQLGGNGIMIAGCLVLGLSIVARIKSSVDYDTLRRIWQHIRQSFRG